MTSITIAFTNRSGTQTLSLERIVQTDSGITILKEGSTTSGVFYPWHRIDYVEITDD